MKLCICCKNCYFLEGYAYSEYTYADKNISCVKNINSENAPFDSQEAFFNWNSFAEKCTKYIPAG